MEESKNYFIAICKGIIYNKSTVIAIF